MPTSGSIVQARDADSQWYRNAVVYEVFVRGFYDATADGNGDLRGLTAKLDYLQWLGVDCLWLLPFYDSPLRDGGYDIADFLKVHPDYGTMNDAITLIEEAHKRGIRVIADMVVNHTSDQHAWFQESRSSRDNPKSDWYVWNDDDSPMVRGPHHLRRLRVEQLGLGRHRASSTGTASTATTRTSTTTTPRSARRCSTSSTTGWPWVSTGSASTRCPTCSRPTARTARTSRPRTTSCASCARTSTPGSQARSCSRRPTSGPRTWWSTSATATSATCASTSR